MYLQMVEVLNLVVFSITIGSQLMAFSKCCLFFSIIHCTKAFLFVAEKIARSVQAMHALHKFSTLSPLTDESK